MNKLKIAFIYSGQPRHCIETFQNHKQFLFDANKDHSIEVFAHLWHKPATKDEQYWQSYRPIGTWRTNDIPFFLDNHRPKAIKVEQPVTFDTNGLIPDPRFPHPAQNVVSMFYSMEEGYLLSQENYENKYDLFVRVRTDSVFCSPIGDFAQFDPKEVHIINGPCHLPYAVDDTFAIGGPEVMDTYFMTHSYIRNLVRDGAAFNPECVLGYNLQVANNHKVTKHNWNVRFYRDLI